MRLLGDLSITDESPTWDHHCPEESCTFLGSWEGEDLYVHHHLRKPTEMIHRFGHREWEYGCMDYPKVYIPVYDEIVKRCQENGVRLEGGDKNQ